MIDARVTSAVYRGLMDAGFRRSGRVFYRPRCDGCHECRPIRVPVGRFAPSRSQRRVLRKNLDVTVSVGPPRSTNEKFRLYQAHLERFPEGGMSRSREDFEEFLYSSPIDSLEMVYRVGRRVVCVGLVDVSADCLSSVYCYYDPRLAVRSLGVFSALHEIEHCRERGLAYWYVGFYVHECSRMNYKAQYRPFELLGDDGVWREPAT